MRDSTREKVEAAIAALGYQPSQSARSLAGRKSFLLGLVYSNPSDSYIIRAQQGALGACRQNGFGLLILPCDHLQPRLAQNLIAEVQQARLDGVVLTPPLTENLSLRRALKRENIPFACVAPELISNEVSVGCDDQKAATEICEYLIERGHRDIAHIEGHPDHSASRLRRAGYEAALSKHNLASAKRWVKTGNFAFAEAKKAASQFLQLKQRPTAIFAASDEMASAVLVVAQELGLQVPEDVSVVGFDDSPLAQQSWPALTTVQQPVEKMVEGAVRGLIQKLTGGETSGSISEMILTCRLVEWASVAKIDG